MMRAHPGALTPNTIEEAEKYVAKFPNAILSSIGEGLGMNGVVISFHGNFVEYHRRLNQLRVDWKGFLDDVQSSIISVGEGEFKRFSLRYLGDLTE